MSHVADERLSNLNVLVTGSSGRIGRYIVQELVEAGHQVLGIDLQPPETRISRFLRVDLTDAGETFQAVAAARADAVIHMGAWADAGIVPDTRTYGDNTQGTFNMLQACADLGVKRVISASSGQVYGFDRQPPLYLPVDEEHPVRPVNAYALSKVNGEQMADYFARTHDMTILSFRLNGIRAVDELPDTIAQLQQDSHKGIGQLWTRTDARDAATACRLALEKHEVASGNYNITGGFVLDENPETLVRRHFGEQVEIRGDLSAHPALFSCAKAEAAFGWRPQYVWSTNRQYPVSESF